jgi:hypothetical protein
MDVCKDVRRGTIGQYICFNPRTNSHVLIGAKGEHYTVSANVYRSHWRYLIPNSLEAQAFMKQRNLNDVPQLYQPEPEEFFSGGEVYSEPCGNNSELENIKKELTEIKALLFDKLMLNKNLERLVNHD